MALDCDEYPVTDAIVEAGSYTNEDTLTILDWAAWVLDGTSGFTERSVTDHPESDGVWFVETVDEHLREHVLDEAPLERVVADAIRHLVFELQSEISTEPEMSTDPPRVENAVSIQEIPGAVISLVRWDDTSIEYYSLGDASVTVRTHDDVRHHMEGGPQEFDAALRNQIGEYLSEDPDASPDQVRAAHLDQIRDSRKYREVPGGFWSLGVNPISAEQALQGEYMLESVTEVYLFTDGFLDVVDPFDLFEDWEAVADYIDSHGIEPALDRLRTAQEQDRTMVEHPRIKPKDDVAVVHLCCGP